MVSEIFSINEGSFPMLYLGTYISPYRLAASHRNAVADKALKRIGGWARKMVSQVTTKKSHFAQSIINFMPICSLSTTWLNEDTIKKNESESRKFYWSSCNTNSSSSSTRIRIRSRRGLTESPHLRRRRIAPPTTMERSAPCFECLERQLHFDFSTDLVFRHGISDSALPFGSSAVVQVYLTGEGGHMLSEDVSVQLVIVGLFSEKIGFFGQNLVEGKDNQFALKEVRCQREVNDVSDSDDLKSSVQNGSLHSISCAGEDLVATDHISSVTTNEWKNFTRMITKLNPVAYIGRASYAMIKELGFKYLSGKFENNAISLINFFTEGRTTDSCVADFLKLAASPSSASNLMGNVKHPNILPILGVLKAPKFTYLVQPKAPYTLENIMRYSPKVLKSDWHIRFLTYQILSALAYMHSLGVVHGNITPSSIHLSESLWVWLSVSEMSCLKEAASVSEKACCFVENCPCQAIFDDFGLSTSLYWSTNFRQWWAGELSNYEYLLVLNKLAGRKWGEHAFHMVMPWVIDFSVKPDENSDAGWRDLTKSKWRLAKGDEQLDFTYSSSEIPHHVSDECLSELAACSYKARRLPLSVLRSAVRSVYEPNEYPSSMQRFYQWTPDECIPEFYSDPRMFTSIHSEMSDLALPYWAMSPEEFISLHRDALESDRVSRQLHHWIDITFGYKLSGQPSVEAKNVMLPASDPSLPKSTGRLQLFTKPHPRRWGATPHSKYHGIKESCLKCQVQHESKGLSNMNLGITGPSDLNPKEQLLSETSYLDDLEMATLFCEQTSSLDPIYHCQGEFMDNACSLSSQQKDISITDCLEKPCNAPSVPSHFDLGCLLEGFEADDSLFIGFQEFLNWRQMSSSSEVCSEKHSRDIFSFGCILAELYLNRPLFGPVSFAAYNESGVLPGAIQELPPHVAVLVEASIHRDWRRRPSAKCFIESPYFSASVRTAYLFLAPFQLLANTGCCFQYAAKLASQGAIRSMGAFAAEMCASFCLPLVTSSLSDIETESLLCLLKEFLNCLSSQAINALVLPMIQKILQASQYSHLKVSLLQVSFVRDLWKKLGKQAYLEKIHPFIVSNLINPPNKITASAASVALIGSSEELGFPITFHQTVLPLIHSFGKGISSDGIDALVRIGSLMGEAFISTQLLPLLRIIILACLDGSQIKKPEPMHSWNVLTLIDSFSTLDGLTAVMPEEIVLKELIQDKIFLHVKVLMQTQLDLSVVQAAATTLISLCKRLGPDFTSLYIMPQLKDLFDELAFSQSANSRPGSSGRNLKVAKQKMDYIIQIESRMDLVLVLYPFLASLIGIEKLRQCCSTWFLLEQILQRYYNWKWDIVGETQRSSGESVGAHRLNMSKISSTSYNPTKFLMNDVGWSIPQSQGAKSSTSLLCSKDINELQYTENIKHSEQQSEISDLKSIGPWSWFPGPDAGSDGPDFLGRSGNLKDEPPWKIKASVLYSTRAHPGAMRSIAVCHDECTVYTGGVGPGFKGSVQKWELARMNCISGYYDHDEVVSTVCTLSASGRIASCDGTIHVWNGDTGKLISAHAESSISFPLPTASKMTIEQSNMLTPNELTVGILSNAFSGSLYTCMHYLDSKDKLVAGMGNGSVRFIDIFQDRKLQLWKTDAAEHYFSSLVSAICSCGSENIQADRGSSSSSWIAAGLSSGYCKLLDARCGDIVAHWRAHDSYITKLAAPEDYLLVSSSFDKSLRVWDLRRSPASQLNVFRVHSDAITSFAVWAQDVISVSRNKIALTSLSGSTNQGGHYQLSPQTLYSADKGIRSQSVISTISILPFSRLFLVGTEDGFLKVCC
ncbi:protein GFS12 isoform X2 [Canna indica]|uniref:Protein GFS12 isoform X2 n=1 Tax=Canna indica TaxID=4628 RepID=A0AAQ3QNJ7_9LILI|nr:protein GFS12 isoform X2 [Canna indica]